MIEVKAELTGSVWKILVQPGDRVNEGDTLLIMESMKMEIPVEAPRAGVLSHVSVAEGEAVSEGQVLAVLTD